MYVKNFTSLSSIKNMHTKENWFLLSAPWCTYFVSYYELLVLLGGVHKRPPGANP